MHTIGLIINIDKFDAIISSRCQLVYLCEARGLVFWYKKGTQNCENHAQHILFTLMGVALTQDYWNILQLETDANNKS